MVAFGPLRRRWLDTQNGELTELHSFKTATIDRDYPYWGNNLILSGENLYGIAWSGGASGCGTIFQLNLATGAFNVLHSFTGTTTTPADGEYPCGSLLLSGTTLYRMTSGGGPPHSYGVIFSYSLK
jgi:uncharacterized repeat protein (TIGR03803 family)